MKFTTLQKAISQIEGNSSLLTFSGMQLNRAPIALVFELIRQKKKNLSLITTPNPLPVDMLIGAKLVKYAKFGFNGFSYDYGFVISPNFRNAIENNLIEWQETDIYEILQNLKASASGKEFLPLNGMQGSDYLKYNNYKKEEGKIVVPPVKPDFALIHAQKADKEGNVFIEDPVTDKLLANASKKVIVSVEKVEEKLKEITIPNDKINSIVEVPKGAFPTACFGFYDYNKEHIKEYIELSKQGKIEEYFEKYVNQKKNNY
jgi:glutaconate CoA-transferase subunit A